MTGGFAGGEAGLQQFLEEGEVKFKDPNAAGMVTKAPITCALCIICPTFTLVAQGDSMATPRVQQLVTTLCFKLKGLSRSVKLLHPMSTQATRLLTYDLHGELVAEDDTSKTFAQSHFQMQWPRS